MALDVLLLVMAGSALGGMARYSLSGRVAAAVGHAFPWGTFAVNVSGCFVIGAVFGLTGTDGLLVAAPAGHQAMTYGFLGGYTTYSTFSLETVNLLRDGETRRAISYVAGSIVAGVAAAVAGYVLVRGGA